nr:NADH-quinone oxidoreductase subunit NuoK [Micromonospora sp. DSM 115978]
MRPVIPYVAAAWLFGLGVYGVLRRRNAVLVLMAVELMLNAVNLILVTADSTAAAVLPHTGQVFALFIIVIAAAEIGVGLAIVLQLYRLRGSIGVDEVPLDRHPPDTGPEPAVDPATTAASGGGSR